MMRIGYRHADRLISYPHAHNLSVSQLPIRVRGRFHRPGGQACTERPGHSADGGLRDLIKVPASATIRPTDTHPTTLATELAQHAIKPPLCAILPALGEYFHAIVIDLLRWANFVVPRCLPRHEMSPPAPMREPQDACMKPTTPLLDDIAAKTGVSGLQWCRRFHRRQSTRQQRR